MMKRILCGLLLVLAMCSVCHAQDDDDIAYMKLKKRFIQPAAGNALLPAFMQARGTAGTASTLATNQSVTSGDQVLVVLLSIAGTGATLTATGVVVPSYATLATANNTADGATVTLLCGTATSSGTETVTSKKAGVTTSMHIGIQVWHNASCTLDGSAVTFYDSANHTSCGNAATTITTTVAGDLVVQVCGTGGGHLFTAGSGWQFQYGDGSYINANAAAGMSSRIAKITGTFTSTDTYSANDQNATIMVALQPVTGSAPTTPSIDVAGVSGDTTISATQAVTMTISASAKAVVCQPNVDSNTVQVSGITIGAGAVPFYNLQVYFNGSSNNVESWFVNNPPTGSQTITATWTSSGDFTTLACFSVLGGSFGFASSGQATGTTSPSSFAVTSATGHLAVDLFIDEYPSSPCPTVTAQGSQVQLWSHCGNVSTTWTYEGSSLAGASSLTFAWTMDRLTDWSDILVDCY